MPGTTLALDIRRPEKAIPRIKEFAENTPLDAILGVDEETVVLAAMASEQLGLPGNPVIAAEATRNKYELRKRLASSGLPAPEVNLFDANEDPHALVKQVSFPCVLKPTFLYASRGVMRADDTDSFVYSFNTIRGILSELTVVKLGGELAQHILVEDYIPGNEVSLEGILQNGKLHVLALFDKPDPMEGPYFPETYYVTPSRLPTEIQSEVQQNVQDGAQALGLSRGPVHAELRLNQNGIFIVEIAARSIGGYCSKVLRFEDDHSLESVILQQALGRDISGISREKMSAGVMMIPPPAEGILSEIKGLQTARSIKGIEEVLISIPVGQKLGVLPQTAQYLGFIFARGESPERVERSLREAYSMMEFVIE